MNGRPITEDDLHAYVDGVLDTARHAEVAAYLGAQPDVARRIEGFSNQRDMLRAALTPIADEPIPPQLNLARIIEARRRRRAPTWWAAAAAVLLCVGGLGGWWLRGIGLPASEGIAALAQEAADSYNVYAPDHVQPVEMRASDQTKFVRLALATHSSADGRAGSVGLGISSDGRAADWHLARSSRDADVR